MVYLIRQLKDVGAGGLPAIWRKTISLLGYSLAILPVLMVRLVRPVVLIRFGQINTTRIGHFAPEAESYLCERDLGLQPKSIDLFYRNRSVANHQLLKMINRVLHLSPIMRFPEHINRAIPGGRVHEISIIGRDTHNTPRDVRGLMAKTLPHLSFTSDEIQRGEAGMRSMGIPECAPYICI